MKDRSWYLIQSKVIRTSFPLNTSLIISKQRLCFLLSKVVFKVSSLWHRKLVHLNFQYIHNLVIGETMQGLPLLKFENEMLCSSCESGKQTKGSHKSILDSSIVEPLELLHINLYGPSVVASLHKNKYILVIYDDFYYFSWVYF